MTLSDIISKKKQQKSGEVQGSQNLIYVILFSSINLNLHKALLFDLVTIII